MIACYCTFIREQDSKTEVGICINEGQVIIDNKGEVVKSPLWRYDTNPWRGCIVVPDEFTYNSIKGK